MSEEEERLVERAKDRDGVYPRSAGSLIVEEEDEDEPTEAIQMGWLEPRPQRSEPDANPFPDATNVPEPAGAAPAAMVEEEEEAAFKTERDLGKWSCCSGTIHIIPGAQMVVIIELVLLLVASVLRFINPFRVHADTLSMVLRFAYGTGDLLIGLIVIIAALVSFSRRSYTVLLPFVIYEAVHAFVEVLIALLMVLYMACLTHRPAECTWFTTGAKGTRDVYAVAWYGVGPVTKEVAAVYIVVALGMATLSAFFAFIVCRARTYARMKGLRRSTLL